jgi:hypothetical protein
LWVCISSSSSSNCRTATKASQCSMSALELKAR